jgi:hypothetical protein
MGVSVNNIDALMQLIRAGAGLGFVPQAIAQEDIAQGRLNVVLPDYATPPVSISVVYPSREYLPAKVRTFIDQLVASAALARESVRSVSRPAARCTAPFPVESYARKLHALTSGKFPAQSQARSA